MSHYTDQLVQWSANNLMKINYSKTKEMLLGRITSNPPPALTIEGNTIERVDCFKLLGVIISSDLRWGPHVDNICSKVNSKLYTLKQLKRAGLSADDLLRFYITAVRPILEYGCVVWHHGLTQAQSDRLESLQKRALRIIFDNLVIDMPYQFALSLSKLTTLSDRRTSLGKSFFNKICQPGACLHNLLPPPRDPDLLARSRHPNIYPIPINHVNHYCSFLSYALAHYQN